MTEHRHHFETKTTHFLFLLFIEEYCEGCGVGKNLKVNIPFIVNWLNTLAKNS